MAKIKKTTKAKKSQTKVQKKNSPEKIQKKKFSIFKKPNGLFGKKSKKTKKTDNAIEENKATDYKMESSKVYKGFMFGFMLFGLLWLIVAYISNGSLLSLGNWNIVVGFAFILTGFFMTTGWK